MCPAGQFLRRVHFLRPFDERDPEARRTRSQIGLIGSGIPSSQECVNDGRTNKMSLREKFHRLKSWSIDESTAYDHNP